MAPLTVDVKWQKELFKGIEIDTEQPPIVFKMQLFTLTGATTRCNALQWPFLCVPRRPDLAGPNQQCLLPRIT